MTEASSTARVRAPATSRTSPNVRTSDPCTHPKGWSSPTWNQPPGASPEHAENRRPRDDPHDRPAAWLATNVHRMGGCRGHRTRRAGPRRWSGSRRLRSSCEAGCRRSRGGRLRPSLLRQNRVGGERRERARRLPACGARPAAVEAVVHALDIDAACLRIRRPEDKVCVARPTVLDGHDGDPRDEGVVSSPVGLIWPHTAKVFGICWRYTCTPRRRISPMMRIRARTCSSAALRACATIASDAISARRCSSGGSSRRRAPRRLAPPMGRSSSAS